MAKGTTSAAEWAEKFVQKPAFERYGAYGQDVPKLDLGTISSLSLASGIHPDVLGPCRRAAAKLGWILMFRPIKRAAMHHVGEFGKLPKPMAVKAKADFETGLVKLKDEKDFQAALKDGRIDPTYAKTEGLKLDSQGFLVNRSGQKFFSDMDLYEVLSGRTGRRVTMGSGDPGKPGEGVANRRELDVLINILRPLGTDFALIQHGPERQWVKHDHAKPNLEPVTAFCPDGAVLILPAHEVDAFIQKLQSAR